MTCPITLKDVAFDEEIAYRATCDQCKLVAYGDTPEDALEAVTYICAVAKEFGSDESN